MSKTKNTPAYLALVVRILETAEALGMTVERDMGNTSTLPENKHFVFVRVDGGTAALIVPMHADEVKYCDSHIDWDGRDGYIPLTKENGAVICRIDPSAVDLGELLTALSGASKRDRKAASKKASPDMQELLAKLQSLGLPKQQPVTAPAPVVTEEESEEELLSA